MLQIPAYNQVYKYIPDINFRFYLASIGLPFDSSGDSLDISSSLVSSTTNINLNCNCIYSLEGIQYFTGLTHLVCDNSVLDSLPALPSTLISLDIQRNKIENLPSLPPNLEILNCSFNPLYTLPSLPSSLKILNCSNDSLLSFPSMPPNLVELTCERNLFTTIPSLPIGLKYLYCSNNNNLTSITSFPDSLQDIQLNYCNLSSIPSLPNSLYTLFCTHNSIAVLPPIPTNLRDLNCEHNHISAIPTLPSTLNWLSCYNNNINRLPNLPNSINFLFIDHNNIDSIIQLPFALREFQCNHNLLEYIVDLPPNVREFHSDSNLLRKLPALPNSLRILHCDYNLLDSLTALPDTLHNISVNHNQLSYIASMPTYNSQFHCAYNNLDSLPPLSSYLGILNCSYCHLIKLPTLSRNLEIFDCSHNNLTDIPSLPRRLFSINCSNNPSLACLPYLSRKVTNINFDSTNIECVNAVFTSTTYYPTIPFICLPNIHACPSYVSVAGKLFNDLDGDCIIDSTENGIANITVYVEVAGSGSSIYTSDDQGNYSSDTLGLGLFLTHIDTIGLPFTVGCPISGYDTILVDTSTPTYTNRHFALNCKPGFDIGTTGVINTSTIFRPANDANLNIHAGDMSDLHGVHCTHISGNIILNYSGHIRYNGCIPGTLLPDTILPNHLVWNIADFSTLDYFNDIKPNFYVDSSAVAGDFVCFNTEVTPIISDRNTENNHFEQCFTVIASYDPNIKEVSPAGSITTDNDWIYYTIHFQNTGSSYAENIYIWDTIAPQLNINTIQAMGASHNQFMQIFSTSNAVRFNFLQINLIDSSTNEPESHGWVRYRIKQNDSLSEGTNIQNTASIYFDLNEPVVTNTTITTICNTTSFTTQNLTITDGQSINIGSNTYTQTGYYTDILSNINGCDSIINTNLQVVSGFEEFNPIRMLMYPNPANNQLFIQIEGVPSHELKIVDMFGRQVYTSENISNKFIVDTDQFSIGSYIVIYGNNHQKLVIQH